MSRPEPLNAPFPYFGGKRDAAAKVWAALGNCPNYIEPFAGSLAVLLRRPGGAGKVETVNDVDGYIANFWRAVKAAPEAVAEHADWPVNEVDLHARHGWLVRQTDLAERLMGAPNFYDAKIAGWWVWGCCAWLGSGWCLGRGPWQQIDGRLVKVGGGQGIWRQLPHLGNPGQGINRQLPHLGDPGRGINRQTSLTRSEFIHDWMQRLADRLRGVRVACGDWGRVADSYSVRRAASPCGIFLDPPYGEGDEAYSAGGVAEDVRAWAAEMGDDETLRIVLCSYREQGPPAEGWRSVAWSRSAGSGGYNNLTAGASEDRNDKRERLWLSPHCLPVEGATLGGKPVPLPPRYGPLFGAVS